VDHAGRTDVASWSVEEWDRDAVKS
jgi:hypothetical protein